MDTETQTTPGIAAPEITDDQALMLALDTLAEIRKDAQQTAAELNNAEDANRAAFQEAHAGEIELDHLLQRTQDAWTMAIKEYAASRFVTKIALIEQANGLIGDVIRTVEARDFDMVLGPLEEAAAILDKIIEAFKEAGS